MDIEKFNKELKKSQHQEDDAETLKQAEEMENRHKAEKHDVFLSDTDRKNIKLIKDEIDKRVNDPDNENYKNSSDIYKDEDPRPKELIEKADNQGIKNQAEKLKSEKN
jgi:vacuolar-type H+-ATPase subunit I/STV1